MASRSWSSMLFALSAFLGLRALPAYGGPRGAAPVLTPEAPTAQQFMWQGQQARLARDGVSCPARIALGVGDQAVCYAAADESLKCAGRIHTHDFGTSFVTVPGQLAVDQILISPTTNSATGNAVCTRRTGGTAWCMGDSNDWGQFGTGSTGPTSTFVQWGVTDLTAIATGTWDQVCALDAKGDVYCSGYTFGPTPTQQGGPGPHSRAWVTTFGTVSIDDPMVWRAAESRTECQIGEVPGLVCTGFTFEWQGRALVAGGYVGGFPDDPWPPGPGCPPFPFGGVACWLTRGGAAFCSGCGASGTETRRYFANGTVLSVGLNFYGNNLCAVYADASLWCLGSNANGMLGTGDTDPRTTPTMVQPPGSVRIGCP